MHNCLICESENVNCVKTKVAKFLCARMLDGTQKETELIHCKDCGFAYYSFRPDSVQMQKLYSSYRNGAYQQQRQACECWYTPEINDLIGQNETERENRENNLTEIIKKFVPFDNINKVLDFGGDKGQHIPSVFSDKNLYVYEISGAEPIDGINKLEDVSEVKQHKYDFLMCCNLLEHVSSPQEIVEILKSVVSENGYLYIELPYDSPFYLNVGDFFQFLFNKYFSILTLMKYFVAVKNEKCFKPMHEHINYFTKESVKHLLEENGFEVLYNEVKPLDSGWCKLKVISVLARY